jgi:hypothetical protein
VTTVGLFVLLHAEIFLKEFVNVAIVVVLKQHRGYPPVCIWVLDIQ